MDKIRSIVARVAMAGALFGMTATAVLAAPITTPPGLNPGDQYRLAFVTSSAIANAQSTSISTYNTFVTGVANSQPTLLALGTTWTAIGSTVTVDARDNTGTNPAAAGVPVYRMDGLKIANDNVDLWDGNLLNALTITEAGNALGGLNIWTGTASSGIGYNTTNVKQLGSSTGLAAGGLNTSTSATWMVSGGYDTASPSALYAMSGVLTVPTPLTLSTVSPVCGTLAGGTQVSLTGTGFRSGMTVTFDSTAVAASVSSGTTATAISPAHARTVVDVKVTNDDNVSDTKAQAFTYIYRGDANGNCGIDPSDIFYLVNNLFTAGPAPIGSGDANGNSSVDPGDIFYMVSYLFAGGPAPE